MRVLFGGRARAVVRSPQHGAGETDRSRTRGKDAGTGLVAVVRRPVQEGYAATSGHGIPSGRIRAGETVTRGIARGPVR